LDNTTNKVLALKFRNQSFFFLGDKYGCYNFFPENGKKERKKADTTSLALERIKEKNTCVSLL